CLSFGAPTLTDQYPFDDQKRKTGMLPGTTKGANCRYTTYGSTFMNIFFYCYTQTKSNTKA
ncbi:hypothetical protein, partial [Microcoleus sp. Z1_B5]|uniref:hypothetical protein n=1 Tax=Microcoleus sp. Z1_B5 TaxID=3055430 RepID=UPI002FD79365